MFYTVTAGDITTLNGYITGMIGDFMPIILVILGITIAMYVFNRITK
jgi:hypothetical protein